MTREEKGKQARVPETEFPYRLSLEGDRVHVIADLLGISEEKIWIDLDEVLVISATEGGRRLRTSIELPWEARLGEKRFRKGVLELTLERSVRGSIPEQGTGKF